METYYLETDLEKINELGRLREAENFRFRTFLKSRNGQKTDALVHRLNEEIAPRIDCTTCGNCCKQLSPYLNQRDLEHLAEATRMSVEHVMMAYIETDEVGVSFRNLPCSFLAGNKCTIYHHRPGTCASFPHLQNNNFNSRLRRTIENYSVCPIIFNVIERMKVELGFDHEMPESD